LIANYAFLAGRFKGPPLTDPSISFPRHQVSLQSSIDFTRRLSLDAVLRRVGQFDLVPGYFTADLRLSYWPSDRVELSVAGRNLLDSQHPEQGTAPLAVLAEVPRAFYGRITWRF
jgi:iron complex outermembrane receptor protein